MEPKKRSSSLKTAVWISVTSHKGRQVLSLRTTPEIEELFTQMPTKKSDTYRDESGKSLEYYSLSPVLNEVIEKINKVEYQRENFITLTNYGTMFYRSGKINLSILRTKGISEGVSVVIDGFALDYEIRDWIHDFAQFVKYLYENYVEKRTITAVINMEI